MKLGKEIPYHHKMIVDAIMKFSYDSVREIGIVDRDKLCFSIPAYAIKILFESISDIKIDISKECTLKGIRVVPNYENKLVLFHYDCIGWPKYKVEQSL